MHEGSFLLFLYVCMYSGDYGVKKCAEFIWFWNSPLRIRRSYAKTHCKKFDACKSLLTIHGEAILNAQVMYGSFLTMFYLVLKLAVTIHNALSIGSASMAGVVLVWPEECEVA